CRLAHKICRFAREICEGPRQFSDRRIGWTHLNPLPRMILDLLKPWSQAGANQRRFAGSRTADNGNEAFLRDLRFEYIELFVATKKILMIVILEGPQSYEWPFGTGKFQVRTHDVVPSRDELPGGCVRQFLAQPSLGACPAMWDYLTR